MRNNYYSGMQGWIHMRSITVLCPERNCITPAAVVWESMHSPFARMSCLKRATGSPRCVQGTRAIRGLGAHLAALPVEVEVDGVDQRLIQVEHKRFAAIMPKGLWWQKAPQRPGEGVQGRQRGQELDVLRYEFSLHTPPRQPHQLVSTCAISWA